MKVKALAAASLLLVTALAAMGAMPPASRATLINAQLTESSGPTSILGGGDHVFVRFGSDAAFGVVYGNATNPNNVYMVALKARYLGVGQVYTVDGQQVAANRPIKIYTLYAIKLEDIIEFRDSNGNKVADHTRTYDGSNFTYLQEGADNFYKKVGLRTSWTRSPIVRSNGTEWRNWNFNVSAQNLPYQPVANYSGSLAGGVELVRFTFHLNASLEQVNNATVPQWKITVASNAGRYYVTNASRLENLTVSGKVVHYNLKWDQEIQGWDYSAGNTNTNSRRLLLTFHAIVGNLIPAALVDTWIEQRLLHRTGEAGHASYDTASGERVTNDTTGSYTAVPILRSPRLEFGGNWSRIGRLTWVSNSTVDYGAGPTTEPLYGQIMAGWRLVARGEAGNLFNGFVLLGGLSFGGGDMVRHDPDVNTDVQADLDFSGLGGLGGGGLGTVLLLAGIATAVAVAALLLLLVVLPRRRRRRLMPPK